MTSDGIIGTGAGAASTGAGLSLWDLVSRVGDFLAVSRSPAGDELDRVIEFIEDGYSQFLHPLITDGDKAFAYRSASGPLAHRWSFLSPYATLTLEADTWEYDLATDFGGLIGTFTYAEGLSLAPIRIRSEGEVRARRAASDMDGDPTVAAIIPLSFGKATGQRWRVIFSKTPDTARTLVYRYGVQEAKLAVALSSGTGTFYETDATYDSIQDTGASFDTDGIVAGGYCIISKTNGGVEGIYRVSSVPSGTVVKFTAKVAQEYTATYAFYDEHIYALGGQAYSQVLLETCLAVAEQRAHDVIGIHTKRSEQLLEAAIQEDRMMSAPDFIGHRPTEYNRTRIPIKHEQI